MHKWFASKRVCKTNLLAVAFAAMALGNSSSHLLAQPSQPSTSREFTIKGVVLDSLRGGYLKDALVLVRGTSQQSVTDSTGQFVISHVSAAEYSLELVHPILDTVGLTVRTQVATNAGRDTVYLILSTPSPRAVVARKCLASQRASGAAAIVGTVFDADTGEPSAGAKVTLEWTDLEINGAEIKRTPQQRVAAVDSDGSYRICGLPVDLTSSLSASRGSDTTASLTVSLAATLAIASFQLAPVTPSPQNLDSSNSLSQKSGQEKGSLLGSVVDATGRPLLGARITVYGDTASTTSDRDGNFQLRGIRPGTRALSVRLLGYEPVEQTTNLSVRAPNRVVVTLRRFVPVLKAVQVSAMREMRLDQVGFKERKRLGAGTYLGPREIEGKNSPRLGILLETVPLLRRYACVKYFVDGHLWSGTSDVDSSLGPDSYLSGAELLAVEVYSALTVPAEFMSSSKSGACATVVIWTKWKVS